MSQMSELLDESTEQLLHTDQDVKNIMDAWMQNQLNDMNGAPNSQPTASAEPYIYEQVSEENQDGNNQGFHLDYNMLPPHNQQQQQVELPEQPSSVAGQNTERVNKEEFPGLYNFEVFIDPHHAGSKSPWVYSQSLKKVYILINTYFPIDYKVTPLPGELMPDLHVRVTPSFSNAQDSQTLVTRCLQHKLAREAINHNVPEEIWEHIIRCRNAGAIYHGGGRSGGAHLSVLVPIAAPQNGLDSVRNMYQFVCKNSCPSGMNRRPLDVVFTLEDKYGSVLGRRILNARICSCPKRDKDKEESEHCNRGSGNPPTKKRKAEKRPSFQLSNSQSTSDLAEYDLKLRIPGKHNLLAVHKFVHDLMAGEMVRHGTEGPYKKVINEINRLTSSTD